MNPDDDIADVYFEAESYLHQHCGVVETWAVYPIMDQREMYWCVHDDKSYHSPKKEAMEAFLLDPDEGDPEGFGDCFYSNEIRSGRELATGVFRGAQYTMVLEDTNTDGNVWWALYRNDHEVVVTAADPSRAPTQS